MKFPKKYSIAISLLLVLPTIALAAFDSVQLNTGSDLRVTVGGAALDLTVSRGKVSSINVNNGNLTAVLSAGSSLDLTSATKSSFTYTTGNATANLDCSGSSSVLTITLSSGPDQTIIVTPTGAICTAGTGSSGGGGGSNPYPWYDPNKEPNVPPASGGGGGGSVISTPPPVANVVSQVYPPSVPPVNVNPPAAPSPVAQLVSPVFNKDLGIGSKGDDTKRLQQLLAKDKSIYPEGLVTGYYGKATVAAVKRFQKKYGLPQVGRIGPKTRAKLKEIFGTK